MESKRLKREYINLDMEVIYRDDVLIGFKWMGHLIFDDNYPEFSDVPYTLHNLEDTQAMRALKNLQPAKVKR